MSINTRLLSLSMTILRIPPGFRCEKGSKNSRYTNRPSLGHCMSKEASPTRSSDRKPRTYADVLGGQTSEKNDGHNTSKKITDMRNRINQLKTKRASCNDYLKQHSTEVITARSEKSHVFSNIKELTNQRKEVDRDRQQLMHKLKAERNELSELKTRVPYRSLKQIDQIIRREDENPLGSLTEHGKRKAELLHFRELLIDYDTKNKTLLANEKDKKSLDSEHDKLYNQIAELKRQDSKLQKVIEHYEQTQQVRDKAEKRITELEKKIHSFGQQNPVRFQNDGNAKIVAQFQNLFNYLQTKYEESLRKKRAPSIDLNVFQKLSDLGIPVPSNASEYPELLNRIKHVIENLDGGDLSDLGTSDLGTSISEIDTESLLSFTTTSPCGTTPRRMLSNESNHGTISQSTSIVDSIPILLSTSSIQSPPDDHESKSSTSTSTVNCSCDETKLKHDLHVYPQNV